MGCEHLARSVKPKKHDSNFTGNFHDLCISLDPMLSSYQCDVDVIIFHFFCFFNIDEFGTNIMEATDHFCKLLVLYS